MQQPAYQDTDCIEDYEDDEPYQGRPEYQKQYQNNNCASYHNQQNDYSTIQSNSRQSQSVPFGRTQNNGFGQ